jgi:hypothetical protein
MVNQVGVVIGIQVMQTVQAARSTSVGALEAYGEAYLVGGAVAAVGLLLAFFVRSTPREVAAEPVAAASDPAATALGATR